MSFYVLDDNNNKTEALDKEGVLNAIETAIANGSLANLVADAAFVTKLKCCVGGDTHQMAFVTQQKYNELLAAGQLKDNTLYNIVDDPTAEELDTFLQALSDTVNQLVTNSDNNTRNINNIYTYLNKLIPQMLTKELITDADVYGIKLRKSGLYAIHYKDVSTGLFEYNILFSYNIQTSRVKVVGDNEILEVKEDTSDGLYYVRPKSLSTYELLGGYLITQY